MDGRRPKVGAAVNRTLQAAIFAVLMAQIAPVAHPCVASQRATYVQGIGGGASGMARPNLEASRLALLPGIPALRPVFQTTGLATVPEIDAPGLVCCEAAVAAVSPDKIRVLPRAILGRAPPVFLF